MLVMWWGEAGLVRHMIPFLFDSLRNTRCRGRPNCAWLCLQGDARGVDYWPTKWLTAQMSTEAVFKLKLSDAELRDCGYWVRDGGQGIKDEVSVSQGSRSRILGSKSSLRDVSFIIHHLCRQCWVHYFKLISCLYDIVSGLYSATSWIGAAAVGRCL